MIFPEIHYIWQVSKILRVGTALVQAMLHSEQLCSLNRLLGGEKWFYFRIKVVTQSCPKIICFQAVQTKSVLFCQLPQPTTDARKRATKPQRHKELWISSILRSSSPLHRSLYPQDTLKSFIRRDDIDIILINQNVAEMVSLGSPSVSCLMSCC